MVNTKSKLKAIPTDSDFDEVECALKWAQLPLGIYSIKEKITRPNTEYGESVIITLACVNSGNVYEVWVPSSRLIAKLADKPYAMYLRNSGLRVSQKNMDGKYYKDRKYFSFELL